MRNIVGVKFRKNCKIYSFDPNGILFQKGDNVIVETVRGLEFGTIYVPNKDVNDEDIVEPLKKVIRKATKEDVEKNKENIRKEKEAFNIFKEKVKEHDLDMKLVSLEYIFDNSKLLFYFTAEGRIDFRDLVKDIASIYKTRIELRQIGARDEVKMLGECGMCGRQLCCNSFLNDFEPVSIKMAKEQGLSLNPTKISGLCGRLMCCLKYEQNVYEEKLCRLPKVGSKIKTPDGEGTVSQLDILNEIVKVKIGKDNEDIVYKNYNLEDVEFTKTEKNSSDESTDNMEE